MEWGLTEEQILARNAGIGGSDARIVVHGTPEARYDLWRVKIGEKKQNKVMSDWNRALRAVTETLQLDWYEHIHPTKNVGHRGFSKQHPEHSWMRCTLDGLVLPEAAPINAKHVSRWTKQAREWCIEHYTCQMTHEALVVGSKYGYLSLLVDEKEPEIIRIDVDWFYAEEIIEREAEFWQACVERVPPPDCAALDTPKVAVEVKRLRTVDIPEDIGGPDFKAFVAKNNWAPDCVNAILQFAETEAAHKAHGAARTEIGKLLPDDIGLLTRSTKLGLFSVKRNAAGALTMTIKKEGE